MSYFGDPGPGDVSRLFFGRSGFIYRMRLPCQQSTHFERGTRSHADDSEANRALFSPYANMIDIRTREPTAEWGKFSLCLSGCEIWGDGCSCTCQALLIYISDIDSACPQPTL